MRYVYQPMEVAVNSSNSSNSSDSSNSSNSSNGIIIISSSSSSDRAVRLPAHGGLAVDDYAQSAY